MSLAVIRAKDVKVCFYFCLQVLVIYMHVCGHVLLNLKLQCIQINIQTFALNIPKYKLE
uniref:Uncharacterized protein n=1 Tax=Octopus bimaculoides TaxID=37653 RepID=A0A0L8GPC6_OCTBM